MALRLLDLEEYFVLPHHSKLVARALLDGLGALLEVAHLGRQPGIADLELAVFLFFFLKIRFNLPGPQPATLAEPERVLDEDDQRAEDAGQDLHSGRNASLPG